MIFIVLAIAQILVFLFYLAITKQIKQLPKWIRDIPVLAPWYNYAGESKRANFSLQPATWLDELGYHHDQDVKSRTIVGTEKNTTGQCIGNIKADLKFILRYLAIIGLFIYPSIKNYGYASGNPLQKLLNGFIYTVIDSIFGFLGCILFIINILLNLIRLMQIIVNLFYHRVILILRCNKK